VQPDVFESPFAATLLATALIEEAVRLIRGHLEEEQARRIVDDFVRAQFPGDKDSLQRWSMGNGEANSRAVISSLTHCFPKESG
jgi:hypothetical protein